MHVRDPPRRLKGLWVHLRVAKPRRKVKLLLVQQNGEVTEQNYLELPAILIQCSARREIGSCDIRSAVKPRLAQLSDSARGPML